jgi:hypothetical protein
MFMALYKFYKSMEMGMRFSMVAALTERDPDRLRAYVLSEMSVPTLEPAVAIETPDREELPLAA